MIKNKAPTMADVAKAAGVSPMTVSRALRPNTSASKETRQKILSAAEKLGYVLDGTASGLSSRHSGFVAMTIPSINNTNFADTVRGLTDGLKDTGLDLLLGYTNYDISEEERLVRSFLKRRPEAIVVTGGNHTEACRRYLSASGVPVIETWDIPATPIDSYVGFSNAEAGVLMAQHLVDQGYRNIGFIGGHTKRDTRGSDRRSGFLDGLAQNGLSVDRVAITGQPPTTMQMGVKAMENLLRDYPDTDAVMCVSDPVAFGAMMTCQKWGKRVPEDIAIAGFGADDISAISMPDITTIDVHSYEIGRQTADIIRTELADENINLPRETITIDFSLVCRSSTRKS